MATVTRIPKSPNKGRILRITPTYPPLNKALSNLKRRHLETIQSGSSALERLLTKLFNSRR